LRGTIDAAKLTPKRYISASKIMRKVEWELFCVEQAYKKAHDTAAANIHRGTEPAHQRHLN